MASDMLQKTKVKMTLRRKRGGSRKSSGSRRRRRRRRRGVTAMRIRSSVQKLPGAKG